LSRASQTFDLLERRLMPLAMRRPRPAYAAAAALGSLRNRLSRRWPSPEQVAALFPRLSPAAARRVAWSIGGDEARNRLLIETIRRSGPAGVRPLLGPSADALSRLRPPHILGMFHVGAIQSLNVAVERLPGPVLVLRQGALYRPAPPVEIESTDGDSQRRASSFRRALVHLKSGGFVVLAFDVVQGASFGVSCLGRELELARGPFALARLTGAPLRPLTASWRKGRLAVTLGETLAAAPAVASDPEEWERALAASAGGWLERYLRAAPADLTLGLLRILLAGGITPESGGR
jgi:hypothetical protein